MGAILAIIGVVATALLGASTPVGWFLPSQGSSIALSNLSAAAACRPSINTNRLVQVDVKDKLKDFYIDNPNNPQFNKEEEIWVLVKENAPIPAWKVKFFLRGNRNNDNDLAYAEMEHLGTSIGVDGQTTNPDINKEVYIGVGWCNPGNGTGFLDIPTPPPPTPPAFTKEQIDAYNNEACLDPLVQDVIFVVNRKGGETAEVLPGATSSWMNELEWPLKDNPEPPRTIENLEKYFWSFNVYYKKSKLPGSPSYSDLPCWMRYLADQCPNAEDVLASHRLALWDVPGCQNENVLAITDPANPAPELIIAQSEFHNIDYSKIPPNVTLANHYISVQGSKTYDPPDDDPIIAQAYESRITPGQYYFNVRLRRGTVSGTATDHVVILDPRISGHEGPYWIFTPILDTSKPFANSLQLGSFVPGIPSFFYEWWTPACKPALYLYPEKETQLSVKVLPQGHLTESIPPHGVNGWNVTA
ncbi:hypothetical protein HY468_05950, partial [Candidatus Roizmanbacteria bacterium]|nr:hypothetical protein [Candidatus Roizmanbacteria bacterium]